MGREQETVQQPLIEYAEKCGWTYVPSKEAQKLRHGPTGRFFYDILEERLLRTTEEDKPLVLMLNEIIEKYPDYEWDNQQERELRGTLYSRMLSFVSMIKSKAESIRLVTDILKLKRIYKKK